MKYIIAILILCGIAFSQSDSPKTMDILIKVPMIDTMNFDFDQMKTNMKKAGTELQRAEGYYYASVIMTVLGAGLAAWGFVMMEENTESMNALVPIGIGINILAIVPAFLAWNSIGKAGSELRK